MTPPLPPTPPPTPHEKAQTRALARTVQAAGAAGMRLLNWRVRLVLPDGYGDLDARGQPRRPDQRFCSGSEEVVDRLIKMMLAGKPEGTKAEVWLTEERLHKTVGMDTEADKENT